MFCPYRQAVSLLTSVSGLWSPGPSRRFVTRWGCRYNGICSFLINSGGIGAQAKIAPCAPRCVCQGGWCATWTGFEQPAARAGTDRLRRVLGGRAGCPAAHRDSGPAHAGGRRRRGHDLPGGLAKPPLRGHVQPGGLPQPGSHPPGGLRRRLRGRRPADDPGPPGLHHPLQPAPGQHGGDQLRRGLHHRLPGRFRGYRAHPAPGGHRRRLARGLVLGGHLPGDGRGRQSDPLALPAHAGQHLRPRRSGAGQPERRGDPGGGRAGGHPQRRRLLRDADARPAPEQQGIDRHLRQPRAQLGDAGGRDRRADLRHRKPGVDRQLRRDLRGARRPGATSPAVWPRM